MNVMSNGGAPGMGAPAPGMAGGDMLSTLLLMMVLCPGMFGGMGENPMMLFLLISMMNGGRL